MTNTDLTAANVSQLSPAQLVEALRTVDPADPAVEQLDIDTIASAVDPKKLDKQEFTDLLAAIGDLAERAPNLRLDGLSATNFARLISRASKEAIETALARPEVRHTVLDEVFRRMEVHFKADRAGSTKAAVHWRISGGSGEGGYDRYETVIENGTCQINREPEREPRCTVTLPPVEFLRLVTGNASAPMLFMTGKLKVAGDLGFAAGLTNLFNIPKA
jgi:putative sterol carrier protein